MDSQQIAEFLRSIPQSNQDPVALHSLISDNYADIALGYTLLLQTIGIVQIDAKRYIKASSQTAKYTLESLAAYVENDLRWIDDWKTRGVNPDASGVLQNGASLLYQLETRRATLVDNPVPSRVEEVVQVLIKRTNPETGESEFLMQYDRNADQYQFIGGRRSPNDKTLEQAILREIDEEIETPLIYRQDYQLTEVIPKLIVESTLSPTFGALTEYHFTIYHMTNLGKRLPLAANDAWIPLHKILSGALRTSQESLIDNHLYVQINQQLLGGLSQLADS